MPQALRSILAVATGLVVAMVTIAVLETASHLVFPPPSGLDPHDPESVRKLIDQLPLGALVSVLAAWTVATFAGGRLAAWIAQTSPLAHSFCVFIVLILSAITTMTLIPHPIWMWIGALTLLPAAMLAAARLSGRTKPAAPTS